MIEEQTLDSIYFDLKIHKTLSETFLMRKYRMNKEKAQKVLKYLGLQTQEIEDLKN